MGFTTFFNNPSTASIAKASNPCDRRAELDQTMREHAELQALVSLAKVAFEAGDRDLRNRCLNGVGTELANIDDSVEEQQRRLLRHNLREAQLALAEFEKQHNIPAIQAELANIKTNADAWERAAARREVIDLMAAFERDILQPGAIRWAEIERRLIAIENRWSGQRVVMDLPHIPFGIFSTGGGLRSVCTWFREVLCAAVPQLFDEKDPTRRRIEAMKAERNLVIWNPLPPEWR